MRVCHVTNFLPGYHNMSGGAEFACLRIAKMLAKAGHETSVISTRPDADVGELDIHIAHTLENFLGGFFGRIPKLLFPYDPAAYISAKRALKKIKPDVVHLHNFNVLSLSMISTAKSLGIPVVFSVYDYWTICPLRILITRKGESCSTFDDCCCRECFVLQRPFIALRKRIFKHALSKIDSFIVLSNSSARIMEKFGIESKKIHLIPLPLLVAAKPKPAKQEKNTILFTGWIQPHKGLHVLLQAMPAILKEIPDAKLYVLGSYDVKFNYKGEIDRLIKKLGLQSHVVLLGKRSQKEVNSFLQKASVVAVPEQWENMSPLIVTEAMALSKPIVASSIGGIPELVIEGRTGFLAEPNDAEMFASKTAKLLKNPKLAEKLGKNARKHFESWFNEQKILKALLKTYNKVREDNE